MKFVACTHKSMNFKAGLHSFLNDCLQRNVTLPHVKIFTVELSISDDRPLETDDWKYLNGSSHRIMFDCTNGIQDLVAFTIDEMKLILTYEELLRSFISHRLRLRSTQNIYSTIANKTQPITHIVKGYIKPVEFYCTKSKKIISSLYVVVPSEFGEEYRFHCVGEIRVGKLCIAHCIKFNVSPKHFCPCGGRLNFWLPVNTKADSILYTEMYFMVIEGGHNKQECIYPTGLRYVNNQTNIDENAESWKQDRNNCLRKRKKAADIILQCHNVKQRRTI